MLFRVYFSQFKMSVRAGFLLSKAFNLVPKNARCSSYKSALSLDKIYPHSTDLKPFKPPESADGKFTGYIPIKELTITSMAASGPGGQHVNKTETKIDIRFHVDSATWLSESTKKKLQEKYYTRINKDGYFIVRSEKTRSKILNQADALTYIRELIFKLEEPKPETSPETLEKIRKNKEKAARMRLMEKKTRSLIKANRGPI